MAPQMTDLEAWALFGKWILAAGGLAGAVLSIVKLIGWIRSKTTVARIEKRMADHDRYFEHDKKELEDHEKRIKCIESDSEDLRNVSRLTLEAVQTLLPKDSEVSTKIQDFLRNKV